MSSGFAQELLGDLRSQLGTDLELAARFQRSLLPDASPVFEGVRVAWEVVPFEGLAGDTLNVFRLDDEHLGLYLLDVSGHGLVAAMFAVTLHRVLDPIPGMSSLLLHRNGGPHITPPAEVCNALNRAFPMDPTTLKYFTLVYGILNTRTRRLRFVAAGHQSPIYAAPGARPVEFDTHGFPIGICQCAQYRESVIDMAPGSRLFFYSDGLTDASDSAAREFGRNRLLKVIAQTACLPIHDSVSGVLASVDAWRGKATLADDLSIMALELV